MQVWTIHISPGIWYNITMRTIPILVILALLLSSCGNGRETVEERTGDTSGAKSAVLSMPSITSLKIAARPTAPLGVFASMFLAQGVFTPSASALKGIDAEMLIIRGQEGKETDEIFALLQEIGNILTVDFLDMLNRSVDRQLALDTYLASLGHGRTIALRKTEELKLQVDALDEERSRQRNERRELQRLVKQSLKEQDYEVAGDSQKKLDTVEGDLAETESKLTHRKDVLERFTEITRIAQERETAIERNRELLLSGLRIFAVPGIEDLGVLQEGEKWKRS